MSAENGARAFDLDGLSRGFHDGTIKRDEFVERLTLAEIKQLIQEADAEAARLKSLFYRMAGMADEIRACAARVGRPVK